MRARATLPLACLGASALGVLVAAAAPAGPRERPGSVTVQGRTQPLATADLGIFVDTKRHGESPGTDVYDPEQAEVVYWFRAKVSGRPGLGPLAIHFLPVQRANGGRHPSLEALGALTLREQDDDYWVAQSEDNDVCDNTVRFLGWKGSQVKLRWEGHICGDRARTLAVDTWADFAGLDITVQRKDEADRLMNSRWGGQPLNTFRKRVIPDHEDMYFVLYVPKGFPDPPYWKKVLDPDL